MPPAGIEERRRSSRYLVPAPLHGWFGAATVWIQDLCEGGFQIEHSAPLPVGESDIFRFVHPRIFDRMHQSLLLDEKSPELRSLEFRSAPVWSRLNSTTGEAVRFRSGLAILDADEATRMLLKSIVEEAGRRGRPTSSTRPRSTSMVSPKDQQAQEMLDRLLLIRMARDRLRGHPKEARRRFDRARAALEDDRIAEAEESGYPCTAEALAIWDYLDRRVELRLIARTLARHPYAGM